MAGEVAGERFAGQPMMTRECKLKRLLQRRLAKVGFTYDALRGASEIVIFGSHAAGVSTRSSDLDVLVVGKAKRISRSGLDLISLSLNEVSRNKWLGSELAS